MKLYKLATLLIMPLLLASCAAVVLGGAAASVIATSVIFETRDFETIKQDRTIAREIKQSMQYADLTKESTVAVNVFEGKVLLAGYAPNALAANQIEDIATNTEHVVRIYNELEIGHAPKSYIKQAVGVNVKLALNTHAWPRTGMAISVTNVYGTIYLMGLVTKDEAKKAAEITSRVKGVDKVITLFDYTNDNIYSGNQN